MLNPIALVATGSAPELPAVEGLEVVATEGPWTLLCLALEATDVERYSDITQQDAKWLSWALARQHSAVTEICQTVAAYPLQFGLIVPAADELLCAASAHHDELERYFANVAGAAEWGIKAILADGEEGTEVPASGMSGLAWLKAKQSAPERRRIRQEAARTRIDELLAPLFSQARARTEVRRQAVVPGQQAQPLLNIALLIDRAREHAFQQDVDAARETLAAEGIFLSCSGPWPPYSFRPRLSE